MILYRIPLKGSEAIGSHLKVKAADLRKTNSLEGWGTQTFHCWDYKPQRPHLPVHTLHALAGGSAQGSSQNSAMKCVACMGKVPQDHTFTRNCCILLKPHGVILFPSLTHATGSEQLWALHTTFCLVKNSVCSELLFLVQRYSSHIYFYCCRRVHSVSKGLRKACWSRLAS